MLVDGQEFHGGDAQFFQVIKGDRAPERGIRPPDLFGQRFAELGEPLDVQLVDHRLVQRRAGRGVVAPVERRIDDHRLGHPPGVVAVIAGKVALRRAPVVAEHLVAPVDLARDGAGVGVDEQFGGVEPRALGRFVGAVNAVAVELAGADLGQKDVPDLVGLLGHADADLLVGGVGAVKEAEIDAGGVLGIEGEVDAVAAPRGAQGIRLAEPDF